MTQQEIIENNTMLFVFLGHRKEISITDALAIALNFDKDWRAIMPVVEEINNQSKPTFDCPINRKRVEIFKSVSLFSPIIEVYKACVDFVKWFNKNKGGK